ncbi:hypothetical protein ANO11243_069830 [Dothideomycetidae sp. 11243]|nr:hypothetical protein ANO11243_069830 [fungal sp. No.11243]
MSTTATTTPQPSDSKKLRILCLHGYTQTGPLFRAKTRALEKSLSKHLAPLFPSGVELFFPDAPVLLSKADFPPSFSAPALDSNADAEEEARAWWRRKDVPEGTRYDGLEGSMAFLGDVVRREGPFAGVLGFSQGAAAAVLFASLVETGRRGVFESLHAEGKGIEYPLPEEVQPFSFVVSYSGFRAPAASGYDAFYQGGVRTPSLHFIGSVDTVVSEERSLDLLKACRDGVEDGEARHRVVYHPGGHFVPASQKMPVNALVGFIQDVMGGAGREQKVDGEGGVEDMDVPF